MSSKKHLSKAKWISIAVVVAGFAAPTAQAHYSSTDGQSLNSSSSGLTQAYQLQADQARLHRSGVVYAARDVSSGVQVIADRPDFKPNPALDRGVQIIADRPDFKVNPASQGVEIVTDRPDFKVNPASQGVGIVTDRPDFKPNPALEARKVSQPSSGSDTVNWRNGGIAGSMGLALLLLAAGTMYSTRRRDRGHIATA
jgi:hypothetical protein